MTFCRVLVDSLRAQALFECDSLNSKSLPEATRAGLVRTGEARVVVPKGVKGTGAVVRGYDYESILAWRAGLGRRASKLALPTVAELLAQHGVEKPRAHRGWYLQGTDWMPAIPTRKLKQ